LTGDLHEGSLDYALAARKLCVIGTANASSFVKPCPELFQGALLMSRLVSHSVAGTKQLKLNDADIFVYAVTKIDVCRCAQVILCEQPTRLGFGQQLYSFDHTPATMLNQQFICVYFNASIWLRGTFSATCVPISPNALAQTRYCQVPIQ
jgi:hypothetical protein